MNTQNLSPLEDDIGLILTMTENRIIVLDFADILERLALCRAAFPEGRLPTFVTADEVSASHIVLPIKKALLETWRYQRAAPDGREPQPGMSLRAKIPQALIVQTRSRQMFRLVKLAGGIPFKVKSVGQTKASMESPRSDPQYIVTLESGLQLPMDWSMFSLM